MIHFIKSNTQNDRLSQKNHNASITICLHCDFCINIHIYFSINTIMQKIQPFFVYIYNYPYTRYAYINNYVQKSHTVKNITRPLFIRYPHLYPVKNCMITHNITLFAPKNPSF
ncbi:unknown [Prevotella sp. CAG:1185]|nr:unknown [Prevotella sp. CAG:1185]